MELSKMIKQGGARSHVAAKTVSLGATKTCLGARGRCPAIGPYFANSATPSGYMSGRAPSAPSR